jgi:nucleoside-diphosphate-sugar epimerase
MLILVTGAAGRIGSHLTRALVREGHRVRAFVLPGDSRTAGIASPQVEFCYGRLEGADAVMAAAQGVDAVFHLGGALTSRGNTDEEFFEFNLRSTFNLLMAVRAHAPAIRRFAYASSDAVYWPGSTAGACYLPVDEAHPRLAGTIYGASKIGAEEMCLTFWRGFGIPVTILRFGGTIDADELINPKSIPARSLFLREMIRYLGSAPNPTSAQNESLEMLKSLGDGGDKLVIITDEAGNPVIVQWGDARDVAEGCVRALETEAAVGEAFNLGSVAPISADELVKYIAAKMGLPYVTASLPIARSPWYISSAKARGLLGYQPRYTTFDMVDDALARAGSKL